MFDRLIDEIKLEMFRDENIRKAIEAIAEYYNEENKITPQTIKNIQRD